MIAFDHCVIHVSDWERSNAFYHDVLKAEVVENGAGGFAYRLGRCSSTVTGRARSASRGRRRR